jgi:spermidine synthase
MRSRAAGRRRPGQGAHIVVRDGPRGRELLVDGTFASFYRPGQVTTGSVWDALVAPVLALPPARRRSLLLLGLGGGSAARILRTLAPRARIVGVELDPEVVAAARRFFDLDALRVEVVIADAQQFLTRSRMRFDAVLDDVFIGAASRVRKPVWLPEPGLRLAAARVAQGGVLASNTIREAAAAARTVCDLFGRGVSIGIDGYHNRIVAGGAPGLSARPLRAAIAADPTLSPTLPKLTLRSLIAKASTDPRSGTAARSG